MNHNIRVAIGPFDSTRRTQAFLRIFANGRAAVCLPGPRLEEIPLVALLRRGRGAQFQNMVMPDRFVLVELGLGQ